MSSSPFPDVDCAIERVPEADRPFARTRYQDFLHWLQTKGALTAAAAERARADAQLLRDYAEDTGVLRGTTLGVFLLLLAGVGISAGLLGALWATGLLSFTGLLRYLAPLLGTGFVVMIFVGFRLSMIAMSLRYRVRRALPKERIADACLEIACDNRELGRRLLDEFGAR